MDEKIVKLQELIDQHDNIVFFGGAGVSTESGIPDFRSQDGLYHQKYDFPPETILSYTFFLNHPEEFYKFYRDKMLCDTAIATTSAIVRSTSLFFFFFCSGCSCVPFLFSSIIILLVKWLILMLETHPLQYVPACFILYHILLHCPTIRFFFAIDYIPPIGLIIGYCVQ